MKLAINGFGRIGRTILRQLLQAPRPGVEVVAINDIASPEECAYLFQYDSTFGPYPADVIARDGALSIGDMATALTQEPDLRNVDLSGVDVVLECTGIARTGDVASRGLTAGARNVLISGPSPAAEVTVVMGANDDALGTARVVSNASCTTNALAPLLKVVDQIGTVVQGHMTTIHCYTNSQPMVDAPRGDLARSRGGAQSMVPTTSSATDLVNTVLPGLGNRVTGAALRVPVASVSAVDLVVTLEKHFTDPGFHDALHAAVTRSPVLGWTEAPLVSSDLRARPESLVIAAPELRVQAPQVRIFGWYDNEWGFSARMIDMATRMAARG